MVFEFDYEISASEDYINLEGYRMKFHVRGQDLATAIYERIENKSFKDGPRPRTISMNNSEWEWQQIKSLAKEQGITSSEYILKKCLL